jgi:hypothetical protein
VTPQRDPAIRIKRNDTKRINSTTRVQILRLDIRRNYGKSINRQGK